MFPPPCLWTVGMVFLGHMQQPIPPPPNTASLSLECQKKSFDFGPSDHNTLPSPISPLNHWQLQSRGLYMCFLEQGDTCRWRQGFHPLHGVVLTNCFFGDLWSSCLEIIDKILPLVFGLDSSPSHESLKLHEVEILHGAPDRGRLTVILCFFHLQIIAPTVVTFSPSCLAMVLYTFQPCVGLQSCS